MDQSLKRSPSITARSSASEDATSPTPLDEETETVKVTEHEISIPVKSPNSGKSSRVYWIWADVNQDIKSKMRACPVCRKHLSESLPASCSSCVNQMLYDCRFDLARCLLEKESLHNKVEAVVGPEPKQPLDEETAKLRKAWQRQQQKLEEQQAKEEEEDIQQALTHTRKEVEEKRAQAQDMRKNLEERRANLKIVKDAMVKNSTRKQQETKQQTDKVQTQYDDLHNRIVDTRAILCREAANLLRLSHSKKKTKDGTIKDRYYITGLLLPDLKDINNMRCTDISAALGTTSRLVILCAFYLEVRLPAEITIPGRDFPLATINTPLTSYLGQRIVFPGSGSHLSAPSSPNASRTELGTAPKPRPLYIGSDDHNESVAQFAKKDPVAFNYFIEGVALLAWNVAWLSRTQGFVPSTETWEDVCNIGRVLHQMLIVQPQSTAITRVLTQRDVQDNRRRSTSTASPAVEEKTNTFPARLGSYSHASAHTFLGSAAAAGDNPSRNWRLSRYAMISDPLRKHLLTEMNNAEWELLDEQEWDDGGEKMDDAVVIKARAMDGKEFDDARSIMAPGPEEEGATRANKGKSGWTKVKNRDKP